MFSLDCIVIAENFGRFMSMSQELGDRHGSMNSEYWAPAAE